MCYFLAKELHIRPYVLLTEWTCEEVLVAYGVYANQRSKESYDMKKPSERAKDKLEYIDRWALPFFSSQLLEDNQKVTSEENSAEQEMAEISSIFQS